MSKKGKFNSHSLLGGDAGGLLTWLIGYSTGLSANPNHSQGQYFARNPMSTQILCKFKKRTNTLHASHAKAYQHKLR